MSPITIDPEWEQLCECLRDHAFRLSYPAFALLSVRLLRSYSFRNVRPVGRRSFKGPNGEAGIDLRATLGTGVDELRVIVQLKKYPVNRNISRLAVDTLRGVMCRDRSPYGIIISTAYHSREAYAAAQECPDWSVGLMTARDLGAMLAERRMGVVEQKHPVTGRIDLIFDPDYFDLLERFATLHKDRLLSLTLPE